MSTIRDRALPLLDHFREKLSTRYGLRRYDVVIRVTTWDGLLPGSPGSSAVIVDTPLVVGTSGRPKVVQVSQRAVIASGGAYQEQDLVVGPFTPPFVKNGVAGGLDVSVFDPALVGPAVEITYLVTGPGIPDGATYKKINQSVEGNFRYTITLRKTGQDAQG